MENNQELKDLITSAGKINQKINKYKKTYENLRIQIQALMLLPTTDSPSKEIGGEYLASYLFITKKEVDIGALEEVHPGLPITLASIPIKRLQDILGEEAEDFIFEYIDTKPTLFITKQ